MAPTGGFPSRPGFQAVGIGGAAPATVGTFSAVATAAAGSSSRIQNTNTGTTAYSEFTMRNSTDVLAMGLASTGFSGSVITGATAGESAYFGMQQSIPLCIYTNASCRINISGSGGVSTTSSLTTSTANISGTYAAFKAANTSRASTVTVTDDPDLVLTSITSGTYLVTAYLPWSQATTSTQGINYRINYTGTVTGSLLQQDIRNNAGSFLAAGSFTANTTSASGSTGIGTTGQDYLKIQGIVTVSTSGTLSVQWAQNSSSANNTTLLAFAYLTAQRIN